MLSRAELLEMVWVQDEPNVFITREQYLDTLTGWEVRGHEVDGVAVGAFLSCGPEMHFATFGRKWSLKRADIRNYLQPLIDRYGFARTKTPKDDHRQQRFNRIIGFVDDGEDEFYLNFRIERLRHA